MSTTVITIQHGQNPHVRRHFRIPASDQTSLAWWGRQGDPSTSMRLLILEDARKNGIVDRVDRVGMPDTATQPATVAPTPPVVQTAPVAPAAQSMPAWPATPNPTPNGTSYFPPSVSVTTGTTAPSPAPSGPTLVTDMKDIENALLREEVRILREQLGGPQPLFRLANV